MNIFLVSLGRGQNETFEDSSWASRNIFSNFYDILQTLLMDESSKIIDSDNSWSSQPWYVRQTDSRYKYSERFQAFLPEISRKIRDIELLRGQIQEPKSSSGIKKQNKQECSCECSNNTWQPARVWGTANGKASQARQAHMSQDV